MTDPVNERTSLYRLYDAEGDLLYVGITDSPRYRFIQHAGDKAWWHLVSRKEIEWRDNRSEALHAENEAIAHERPRYNGYHHLGPGWAPKARKYDDTEDRKRVNTELRAALSRGDYKPGLVLRGSRVGRDFGASATTCRTVMNELVKEGLLLRWDR